MSADYRTPAPGTPVTATDGPGIMRGVTGHLYAVTLPDGRTMGYAPDDVTPCITCTHRATHYGLGPCDAHNGDAWPTRKDN